MAKTTLEVQCELTRLVLEWGIGALGGHKVIEEAGEDANEKDKYITATLQMCASQLMDAIDGWEVEI